MILYRSSHKQDSGTEVYIDNFKRSDISRVNINSPKFVWNAYPLGAVVSFNNYVYYLYRSAEPLSGYNSLNMCKWNGNSWSTVINQRLPYVMGAYGQVVVFNNEIHMLGGNSNTAHYKWNGESASTANAWTSVSTLPMTLSNGCAVVFNNELHILGDSASLYHYKWNGSSWSESTAIPLKFITPSAVVFNNAIHIIGAYLDSNLNILYTHLSWDGTNWTTHDLPDYYNFTNGSMVVFNNELHLIGGSYSCNYHYKWDGTTWTQLENTRGHHAHNSCVVFKNAIYGFGYGYGSLIEKIDDSLKYTEVIAT